uniref:Myosin motor domain-containing protein n=1 Tax=Ascaris lumbricoides TaxID=6252 RepID=A0A0M3IXS0_ASCLU
MRFSHYSQVEAMQRYRHALYIRRMSLLRWHVSTKKALYGLALNNHR